MSSDSASFEFSTEGLDAAALSVVSFRGRERISGLYDFRIRCESPHDWIEVERKSLAKRGTLTLRFPGAPPRIIQGIVASVRALGVRAGRTTESGEQKRVYLFRLVPKLWLLTQRKRSRVFQNKTLVEIVSEVLTGIPHRWAVAGEMKKRAYCVQYEETDFAFLTRMLGYHGVFYYFQQPTVVVTSGIDADNVAENVLGYAAKGASLLGQGEMLGKLGLCPDETVVLGDAESSYLNLPSGSLEEFAQLIAAAEVSFIKGKITEASAGMGGLQKTGMGVMGEFAELVRPPASELPFRPEWMHETTESCHKFTLRRRVRPTNMELRDFEYKRPSYKRVRRASMRPGSLAAMSSAAMNAAGTALLGLAHEPSDSRVHYGGKASVLQDALAGSLLEPNLEYYEHRAHFQETDATDTDARVLLEQHRCDVLRGVGRTTCRRLRPGHRFALTDHVLDAVNQEYVITEVVHEGRVPEASTSRKVEVPYRNRVACVPAYVPYRPKRPPPRTQQVVESATVVGDGPAGSLHASEYGAIKVQFHWDRDGKFDDNSSCFIRVAQAWAGDRWGFQFLPRVGMEVLVAFYGGDVDCPVILGAAYNAARPEPFALPVSATRSGIRTQTVGEAVDGQKAYNELSFEDGQGKEEVYLRASRDLVEYVGRDRSITVQGADRIQSGKLTAALAGRSETISDHDYHAVRGDFTLNVGGDVHETVSQNVEREVVGEARYETAGSHALVVGKNLSFVVGASQKKESSSHHSLMVHGSSATRVAKRLAFASDSEILLVAGNPNGEHSMLRMTPSGITLVGKEITQCAHEELRLSAKGPAVVLTDTISMASQELSMCSPGGLIRLGSSDMNFRAPAVQMATDEVAIEEPNDDPEPKVPFAKRFVRFDPKDKSSEGKPRKNLLGSCDYVLETFGFRHKSKTDPDGVVKVDIPASSTEVSVTIWEKEYPTGPSQRFQVAVVPLEPPDTVLGCAARLRNLGLYRGADVEQLTAELRGALRAFQIEHGLSATGELDAQTQNKLGSYDL